MKQQSQHSSAEAGFTLIELLVVVAIIGILAAVAIPQFAAYKTRSFNARAESDLRNAISAQEAYYVTNETYISCSFNTTLCATVLPGYTQSSGVLLFMMETSAMTTTPAPGGAFAAVACHPKGDQVYDFGTAALVGIDLVPGQIASHPTTDCLETISSVP